MEVSDGLSIDVNKCTGCGYCEPICPTGAIDFQTGGVTHNDGTYTPTDGFITFYADECILCGFCVPECPVGAITIARSGEGGGGPGGGSNPPGGDASGGGGGGGGGTGGGLGIPDVDHEFNDPCLVSSYGKAFGNDQKNVFLNEFSDILGTNEGFDVTFYQVSRPDANEWATTEPFSSGTGPDAAHYFYIKMNMSVIKNSAGRHAAEEAIVATMYHEMIHVILETRKIITGSDLEWNEPLQHEVMARAYIGKMTDALMGLYPNLSQLDAEALSWEGLQDTTYWQQWAALNPVEANEILLRADKYDADGTSGERCQ